MRGSIWHEKARRAFSQHLAFALRAVVRLTLGQKKVYQKLTRNTKKKATPAVSRLFAPVGRCVAA